MLRIRNASARLYEHNNKTNSGAVRAVGKIVSYTDADDIEAAAKIIDQETGAAKLADALKDVMSWIDNWSPPFIYDPEWEATQSAARSALSEYDKS